MPRNTTPRSTDYGLKMFTMHACNDLGMSVHGMHAGATNDVTGAKELATMSK